MEIMFPRFSGREKQHLKFKTRPKFQFEKMYKKVRLKFELSRDQNQSPVIELKQELYHWMYLLHAINPFRSYVEPRPTV
jgi:hypothetical protein